MTFIQTYEWISTRIGKDVPEKAVIMALVNDHVRYWCRDLQIPKLSKTVQVQYGESISLPGVSSIINAKCCTCEGRKKSIPIYSITELDRVDKHNDWSCIENCCQRQYRNKDVLIWEPAEPGMCIYPIVCDCCSLDLMVVANDMPEICDDLDPVGVYINQGQELNVVGRYEDGFLSGVMIDLLGAKLLDSTDGNKSGVINNMMTRFKQQKEQAMEKLFSEVSMGTRVI